MTIDRVSFGGTWYGMLKWTWGGGGTGFQMGVGRGWKPKVICGMVEVDPKRTQF